MRQALVVAVALLLAPLGAEAADLVVWWEKGFYDQANEAVAEIVAAFEQETGKDVELIQPEQDAVFDKAQAALASGQPPDFLFSTFSESWAPLWAYEDRLVELDGVLGPTLELFDADLVEAATLPNGRTDRVPAAASGWHRIRDRSSAPRLGLEKSAIVLLRSWSR